MTAFTCCVLYASRVKTGSAENEAQIEIFRQQSAPNAPDRAVAGSAGLEGGGVAARSGHEHEDKAEGEGPEGDPVGPRGEVGADSSAVAGAAHGRAGHHGTNGLVRRLARG